MKLMSPPPILLNGQTIGDVDPFVYLGIVASFFSDPEFDLA